MRYNKVLAYWACELYLCIVATLTTILNFIYVLPLPVNKCHNDSFKYKTCIEAVYKNDLLELEQMVKAKCPVDDYNGDDFYNSVTNWVAEVGYLPMLQYLVSIGCKVDNFTCESAAQGCNLDILKWLRSIECPWDDRVCVVAAKHNNMQMIVWARNNGCPVSKYVVNAAAYHGNFEILRWALSNNCKFDHTASSSAAAGRNFTILQYLVARECPLEKHTMYLAVVHDDLSMVNYLFDYDCPFDKQDLQEVAARTGNVEMCKYLLSKGCSWSNGASKAAILSQSDTLIEWSKSQDELVPTRSKSQVEKNSQQGLKKRK